MHPTRSTCTRDGSGCNCAFRPHAYFPGRTLPAHVRWVNESPLGRWWSRDNHLPVAPLRNHAATCRVASVHFPGTRICPAGRLIFFNCGCGVRMLCMRVSTDGLHVKDKDKKGGFSGKAPKETQVPAAIPARDLRPPYRPWARERSCGARSVAPKFAYRHLGASKNAVRLGCGGGSGEAHATPAIFYACDWLTPAVILTYIIGVTTALLELLFWRRRRLAEITLVDLS